MHQLYTSIKSHNSRVDKYYVDYKKITLNMISKLKDGERYNMQTLINRKQDWLCYYQIKQTKLQSKENDQGQCGTK